MLDETTVSKCKPGLGSSGTTIYFGAAGVPTVLKRVNASFAAPVALLGNENGSQGWIRTTDLTVNNRSLYR